MAYSFVVETDAFYNFKTMGRSLIFLLILAKQE